MPSSFISDAELFGDDDLECHNDELHAPYLQYAPAPPREYAMPPQIAMPLLPLHAPSKTERKRRRSSRKASPRAKPMTPISESIETPE
jgi:hypothetical protein